MQQLAFDTSSPELIVNENFETLADLAVYGKDQTHTSALTWGYYGGVWGSFTITDGTVSLTASSTNYLVVAVATGVLSVSTSSTNWNDTTNYVRVYKIVTGTAAVTSEESHRVGPGGVLGAVGAGGGSGGTELKGLTFTSDTSSTADSDPGNGKFKWNNATEASATVLFFDNQTADGVSLTTFYASLGSSGFIYMQQQDDATKWQLWKWTATPVNGTGYYKFTATIQASAGAIGTGKLVDCDFSGLGSTTAWGGITGSLSSQTDLQAALDLKQARSPAIQSVASASTVTPTFSNDIVEITAQAAALTLANPTGTAIDALGLVIRIKDNGTARAITYGTQYRAIGITLPTTTVISKTMYLAMVFNNTDTKWDVIAVGQEA